MLVVRKHPFLQLVLFLDGLYFLLLFVLSRHLIALLSRLAADQLGRQLVFAAKGGKSLLALIFLNFREFNLSRTGLGD